MKKKVGKTIFKGLNSEFRDLLTLDSRLLFVISRRHRVQKCSLIFNEDIKQMNSNVVSFCKVLALSLQAVATRKTNRYDGSPQTSFSSTFIWVRWLVLEYSILVSWPNFAKICTVYIDNWLNQLKCTLLTLLPQHSKKGHFRKSRVKLNQNGFVVSMICSDLTIQINNCITLMENVWKQYILYRVKQNKQTEPTFSAENQKPCFFFCFFFFFFRSWAEHFQLHPFLV